MAVSVKMGVDVTQFKQGMQQAQQSAKTLAAQMKANEAQYKATGDREKYLAEQSKLMRQQMAEQEKAAKNAEQAMEAMRANGVDQTSDAYQRLAQQLAGAQAAMYNTQNALNSLGQGEQNAASGANGLAESLTSINKKVSLDAVIGGIDKISGALEKAGQKAVDVGKKIWDTIMDSASYADDISTIAEKLGLTTTEVQQMEYIAGEFEAPVETIGNAWKKVKRNLASDSKDIKDIYRELGVSTTVIGDLDDGGVGRKARDYRDVFWETGEALMKVRDETKREEYAQKLLGKSWDELIPLFNAGREAYEEAMAAAPVASEKAVEQAAELNTRIEQLEKSWNTLKLEVIGGIAPALEKAAAALEGVINSITEYLQTDEGQEQLKRMSDAISGIIDDVSNIDPEKIVSGFASIIEGITGAFEWIADHWDEVKIALIGIAGAFVVLKTASLGLTIGNLVNGFKGLRTPTTTGTPAAPTGTPVAPTATGGASSGASQAASQAATQTAVTGGSFLGSSAAPAITGAGGGATYASVPGLSAMAGGGEVGGALGVGNLSAVGVLGGAAVTAAIVYFGSKAIADLNDAANEAREVSKDEERLAETFRQFEQDYSFGGINKKAGAENAITAFMKETGADAQKNGYRQMQNLAQIMGTDLYDLFNYENTSGEKRNKLVDMLDMDPQNAAVAGMMLHYAGIDLGGAEGQAAQTGYKNFLTFLQNGQLGTEALTTLGNYFNQSTAHENGKYVIHGMEASNEIMPVINGQPLANMSGYVMTPAQSKPTTMTNGAQLYWNGSEWVDPGMKQVTIGPGTWDPNEHNESAEAQSKAAESMNTASEAMKELPGGVADAVSKVKINTTLSLFPHANGIWSVPWDGYPALLHRGERVVPAGQARQYNSNIYFGNVNLNNGLEIEALTESIDRRNRRQMNGYGS